MKQDWAIKQLGDVCSIQLGKTPHRKTSRFWDNNKETNNVWLSIADLTHGADIFDSKEYVSDLGAENINVTPKGTIMLSFKLTLGRVSFAGKDLLTNEAIASLIDLGTEISKKFLFYYFSYFDWDRASQGDIKVKGRTLNKAKLKVLEIPIPPIDVQKRIVAKLDECFEAIDKARANVEKNLRKTEELYQSLLFQILYQDSEKWEKSTLGESCEFFNGKAHEKAIHTDGNYVVVNSKFISRDGNIKKYTREQMFPLFKNDIVMVMSDVPNGKALAKCYLIEKDNTYSLNQRICAIRSENYIHKYLFYQLNRHRHLLSFNNGENQTNLRKNDILNTPLYIPPFDDQEEVVKKLDEVVSQTKSLESNYQQEMDALDELKKSILQKAFNGEL